MSENPLFQANVSADTAPTDAGQTQPDNSAVIAELKAQMDRLQAQLAAATNPDRHPDLTEKTTNSAGIGGEVRATWSQYDQELANAGAHPLQLSQKADWLG